MKDAGVVFFSNLTVLKNNIDKTILLLDMHRISDYDCNNKIFSV